MRLLDLVGAEHPVLALAARGNAETVVVLLNRGEAARSVSVAGLPSGEIARLRVHPGVIPYRDGDLPLDNWTPVDGFGEGRVTLELLPREASYLRIPVRGTIGSATPAHFLPRFRRATARSTA